MSNTIDTIDLYIASAPAELQEKLHLLRSTILKAAPAETTETITYKMPTFRYNGNLIHFAYFKNHIGIYPGDDAILHFSEQLKEYKTSKGAFQIPIDDPIPEHIIQEIVKYNAAILKDKKGPNWHENRGNWQEAEELMQQIIVKTPLDKTFKWGINVYVYEGKNVVAWSGFKNFFSIWFYNGVFLEDKENVLIAASEGQTKALRQWRFKNVAEMNEAKILAYILESIQTIKDGKEIKPEKSAPKPLEGFLKEQLEQDKNLLSAFNKLTPSKQKEYIIYIEETKQEKTKISRMDKIKPLILSGKGLNDKYKK